MNVCSLAVSTQSEELVLSIDLSDCIVFMHACIVTQAQRTVRPSEPSVAEAVQSQWL